MYFENNNGKKIPGFKNNKGISLIEIVLSVAILGILTVAFFSVFTTGSVSIFTTGQRNVAMAAAADKIELLYSLDSLDPTKTSDSQIVSLFAPASTTVTTDPSQLYTYTGGGSIRFYRTPLISPLSGGDGYKVTIVVFYQNGKSYVELSSFYKDKGAV